MKFPPHVKNVLLTGGAGFIGSHVLDLLAPSGIEITVFDNLTSGKREYIEQHMSRPNVRFLKADILELDRLIEATRGKDLVWHLAANTDIINSHGDSHRVISTIVQLERLMFSKQCVKPAFATLSLLRVAQCTATCVRNNR